MNKIMFCTSIILLMITLTGCGGSSEDIDTKEKETDDVITQEQSENNDTQNNVEDTQKDDQTNDISSESMTIDSDNIIENDEYKVVITGAKQITRDMNNILAIDVTVTHKNVMEEMMEDVDMDLAIPIEADNLTASMLDYKQNNEVTTYDKLPDSYKSDLARSVEPGETIDSVIGIRIKYPGEPITIYPKKGETFDTTFSEIQFDTEKVD